jgi:alpha-tubulin suppressor-like RCC1 family protein
LLSVKIVQISTLSNHALALSDQGKVYSWGFNFYGQLGVNYTEFLYSSVPVFVNVTQNSQNIKMVSAGFGFSVALREDGLMIYTWGKGNALGNGDFRTNRFTPVQVNMTGVLAGKVVTSIATSTYTTLALTQDGQVYTWGDNVAMQMGSLIYGNVLLPIGIPTLIPYNITQIALNDNSGFALTANSTLFTWGSTAITPIITDTTIVGNIESIFAKGGTLTITSQTKQVYTSGDNNFGGLGNGGVEASPLGPILSSQFDGPVQQAACTTSGGIVITVNGTVYTWGNTLLGYDATIVKVPRSPITTGVLAGREIASVSAGNGFTIALTIDGQLFAWGDNLNLCLGSDIPIALVPVAVPLGVKTYSVTSGWSTVAAMTAEGLYMWGSNIMGQLGIGSFDIVIGPKRVDTSIASGLYGKQVTGMAVANEASFAITSEGKVYAWGSNSQGLLGNIAYSQSALRNVPTQISGPLNGKFVTRISAGYRNVAVLTNDGMLYAWGKDSYGVLGRGVIDDATVPEPIQLNITTSNNVTDFCVGFDNMAAVTSNGSIYSWGPGENYANGDGTNNTYSLPSPVDMTNLQGKQILSISCGASAVIVTVVNGTKQALFGWGGYTAYELGATQYKIPTSLGYQATNINVAMSLAPHTVILAREPISQEAPTPTPMPTTSAAPTTTVPTTSAPTTTATQTTTAVPATMSPTTTNAPTTTITPSTTETQTSTIAPTTTYAPTTTVSSPTTTDVPSPATPTATPTVTPSDVPTSTSTPTTTVTPTTTSTPTTTVVPTMPVPSTSALPTTTAVPTTTVVPTTSAPTTPPVIQIVQGTITSQVIGNISLVPRPVFNTSLVLFASTNVTVTLPIAFAQNATIPKEAIIARVSVSFSVTYIAKSAQLAVILSDEDGNQAGNVTVTVDQAGAVSVNMKDVLNELIRVYQTPFTIRAIRGSILKVSVGVVTEDVPINIDPTVTSTIEYSTPVTAEPTTVAPTSKPTTSVVEPQTLSGVAIALIVVGSVIGTALVLIVVAAIIIVIIVAVVMVRRKKVYIQEKALFQLDNDQI